MANITYKSLADLSPVVLDYNYTNNEKLNIDNTRYRSGYNFYQLNGTKNFQDIAINKDTCLILTSAVSLQTVFNTSEKLLIGRLPASILLQPRNSAQYYVKENTRQNTLSLALTSSSAIFIQPVANTEEVELFVNGKYVQVREEYPFDIYLNEVSLDENEINRQRYRVVQKNNIIVFKTRTKVGYRYLCVNNDNIMRATGVVLNNSIINDYVFKCIPVTTIEQQAGFLPYNNWTTYFFEIQSKTENKTVEVNKDFVDTSIHYLIDFPYQEAAETGKASINIANLKTNVTPTGGPAPVDNSYTRNIVTTN